MKKNKQRSTLTTPDLVILSLLSESPMHGYQINIELERRDVKDWASVSRPQVYYSLNKLKSIKMIVEASDSDPAEGPDRQVYRTSQKGCRALSEALESTHWAVHRPIPAFFTWMALSTHANHGSITRIISERKKFLMSELKREQMTLKSFADETGEMTVPAILMVELTIAQFKIELSWLRNVEKKLEGIGKDRS